MCSRVYSNSAHTEYCKSSWYCSVWRPVFSEGQKLKPNAKRLTFLLRLHQPCWQMHNYK
ncbi:hypothetical protein I79_000626 [Cricetulus griseus]|uniref:Uncharacterized protein n=1 Tax=Cricetulus griseus TaxID=10029 RepID=G3GSL0_CRIGR|nr:hypothetical protein I79_000626 [Cricetulus griseus]